MGQDQWIKLFSDSIPEPYVVSVAKESFGPADIRNRFTIHNGKTGEDSYHIDFVLMNWMPDPVTEAARQMVYMRNFEAMDKDQYAQWMRASKRWTGSDFEVVDS